MMNLLKVSIVPSNIHSLLTKCIVVGLFFSLIKDASFMEAASRRRTMNRKSRMSRSLDEAFNNGNGSCDPCEDFYEYTCGLWAMNNKPPENVKQWSNLHILKEKTQTQLYELLIAESTYPEHHLITKTKQLYNACMNDDILRQNGLRPLLRVMPGVGHWVMIENVDHAADGIPWLAPHFNYIRITGEGALFNINVLPDPRNPTMYRIHILPPISIFGQYRSIAEEQLSTYKNSLKSIVRALARAEGKSDISEGTIQRLVDDVIDFRQDLRKLVVVGEKSRDKGQLYNAMLIAELQNWNTLLAKKHNIVEINWLYTLTRIFRRAREVEFDEREIIIVEQLYLTNLLHLLRNTSAYIIAHHIELHFAEMHLRYTTPEMRTLVADLHTSLTGAQPEHRRWYNCIQENEMKHVLASMYVEKHFPASNEKEVTEIFGKVKGTVRRILKDSFLQEQTKESVIKKLRNMRAILGYRAWHMNYRLLSSYYEDQTVGDVYLDNQLSSKMRQYRAELELLHHNMPEIIDDNYAFIPDAKYQYGTNTIEITASFLQWPYYSPSSHASIAYGTTGHLLAHEIFHAFDQIGIKYDENAIARSQWSPSDLATYRERTVCIVKKYAESLAREEPPENAKLIAERTVGEDFPDILGLEAAFRTYKNEMHRQRRQSLNGDASAMDRLHEDRIFFRAYGNMLCGFITSGHVIDVHSIFKLRVNGPLSNLREFSDVFKCHDGQPMRVKKKCAFWKA